METNLRMYMVPTYTHRYSTLSFILVFVTLSIVCTADRMESVT